MKTRIVHTKVWDDDFFTSLSPIQSYLFLYLTTNSLIGLTGIYEITDRKILFDTRVSQEELETAKKLFEDHKKIFFYKSWVYVVNAQKLGGYFGQKILPAVNNEISLLPKDVKAHFDSVSIPYQYSIDTPINHNTENINHNSELLNRNSESIINNKEEIVKEEKKKSDKTGGAKNHSLSKSLEIIERLRKNNSVSAGFINLKVLIVSFLISFTVLSLIAPRTKQYVVLSAKEIKPTVVITKPTIGPRKEESVTKNIGAGSSSLGPIEQLIYKHFPKTPEIALAVFTRESRLNPQAQNWNCEYTRDDGSKYSTSCRHEDRENAWSVDCGLAQLNFSGKTCPPESFDPEWNLRQARSKYDRRGWQPWAVCTLGIINCK